MLRQQRIRITAVVVAGALALGVVGCTPGATATPTPTATGFASDEEAFAAAEETYRAYIDATNNIVLSDETTFEPLFATLTGPALDGAREEFGLMSDKGFIVDGESKIASIEVLDGSSMTASTLDVCLDVSQVTLTNSSGESVVSETRPDVQTLRVDLTPHGNAEWRIRAINGRTEGAPC